MEKALRLSADIINSIHDVIISGLRMFDLNLTDKDLHFWLIGVVGLLIFIITDFLFYHISRWNISVISFIYTFTVLVVLVFGLEIEQKITGRGNMEFADIIAGLWGFVVIFGVYLLFRIAAYYIKKLLRKY